MCHWVSVLNQCLLKLSIPLSIWAWPSHSTPPHSTPLSLHWAHPCHISKTHENSHCCYKWYFKRTESSTEATRSFSYTASKVIPDNGLPSSFMDAGHLLFTALKLRLLSNLFQDFKLLVAWLSRCEGACRFTLRLLHTYGGEASSSLMSISFPPR